MTDLSAPPSRPPRFARLRTGGPRALAWQLLLLAVLLGLLAWMGLNAHTALTQRGMTSGFGFLATTTSFSMGEGFFSFTPQDSYLTAFATGLGNTVMLSLVSALTASVLGVLIGAAALARHPLPRGIATAYVYAFRNTPQLLQIIFWYGVFALLPAARDAISLGGVAFASNRGLTVPAPLAATAFGAMLAALVLGALAAAVLGRRLRALADPTRPNRWIPALRSALIVLPPLLTWAAFGFPTGWSVPELGRFNFSGGATLTPEFLAIYFGLSFYIAAFVAEIVRGGIQSVDAGQIEAARVVGLSEPQVMTRVVAPQALRLMIPPLAAQYISLIKNSSLGVAVGYPDLFSVSNTALTYSGRTIEVLVLMGLTYLLLSLVIGALAAAFNRLVQFPSR